MRYRLTISSGLYNWQGKKFHEVAEERLFRASVSVGEQSDGMRSRRGREELMSSASVTSWTRTPGSIRYESATVVTKQTAATPPMNQFLRVRIAKNHEEQFQKGVINCPANYAMSR